MEQTLLSQHRAQTIWRSVFSACLAPALALANPVGESVRFGDVDFVRKGNRLDVIQRSNQAIIDWSAFSIANGEITDFSQPGAAAAALNRVTGISASQIDGLLRSNGRILLLNPNGIVIGPNGRVDTASFVASTLDISDSDFLAGGDLPLRGASQASVINLGTISAFDGDVFLVAASVENQGSIFAPSGTAGLAGGNDVLIRESGEERVWVRGASGSVKDNGVVNSGTVEANIAELKSYGGNVYGMAVKNEGRVAATGVTRQGGQIFLSAGGGSSKIRSTGQLVAKRPTVKSGGRISIQTSGTESQTEVGGVVDAGSTEDGGHGGEVLILGTQIDILPDSVILADGENGGGRIQIGGGRRGENPDFNNAEFVNVAGGVEIDASATVYGDGGEVILFAEDTLDFFGHALVRGGDESGDGGFVELSGKRKVNFDGFAKSADTSAANGNNGSLLFDPIDVVIANGLGSPGTVITTPIVSDQTLLWSGDISSYLQNSGDLTIETGAGTGEGNITFSAGSAVSWTSGNSFTVTASGSIIMANNSSIQSELGAIKLENLGGSADGILMEMDSSIQSSDGDIILIGRGGLSGVGREAGIQMETGSSVSSSGLGSVMMTGYAGIGGTTASIGRAGIGIRSASVSTASGNLTLDGTGLGSAVSRSNLGISLIDAMVSSVDGNIQLTGSGGVGTVDQTGVRVGGTVESTGIGSVRIDGFGGSGTGALHQGVYIAPGATVAAGDGNIVIEGTGGASTNVLAEPPPPSTVITLGNPGIHNEAGLVEVRGTGNIRLTGSAGTTGRGVFMRGSGNIVETADGNIVIQGKAKGSSAIEILDGSVAAGSGKLTYDGESETGLAADLAGSLANVVEVISRRGDVDMSGFENLVVDTLILRDDRLGMANFDFSSGGIFVDTLSVASPIGSLGLDNNQNLTVGALESSGSVVLTAEGVLTTTGDLDAGIDVSLAAETLNLNHAVTAGGVITTNHSFLLTSTAFSGVGGPSIVAAFDATPPGHVLNARGGLFAPSIYINGDGGDDIFNINGALGDRDNGIFAEVSGGGGIDILNVNRLDLESTALNSIESTRGTGAASAIRGRDTSETYVFSMANVVTVGGFDFEGFDFLESGRQSDTFRIAAGTTAAPHINDLGGIDTLVAGAGDDFFTVTSENGGNLNSRVRFSSVEKLSGGEGNDQFTFENQAVVDSVDGGDGIDKLSIDDTSLGGTNSYTVSEGVISRNPQYYFTGIESIQLLLGPGNDTVTASGGGFDLELDGGAGFDTLVIPGPALLDGSPITIGGSTIVYRGFEAPLGNFNGDDSSDFETPLGFLIVDLGDLLTLELDPDAGAIPGIPNAGGPGKEPFTIENNFNESGDIEGFDLLGLNAGGAGFFGAAPAVAAALANLGQAVVITVDGGQFLLDSPASLDGTFAQPSFEVIAALRDNLSPTANGELARALEYLGGAFLIDQDGATSIDLTGPPPPALLALLQGSLKIGAAQELAGALGLVIALPLTNVDGPAVIGLVVIQPGQETLQALLDHLGAAAENELQGALGN